eukprot:TRINITY_DN468_c0_g1_i2.p1 TRINITY_DN468_c0_g1~~TRINITY_DN468_c0_g1_i2.p1  ORF type:complete len:442 (+),score=165.73 TRINITY_DN468_c0_g1_i2:38-1327(+)
MTDTSATSAPTASSSSASSAPITALQIADLLSKGKEARFAKDLPKALELFETALKGAVEVFGQLAEETAPLYLQYGQVLYELAVQQSDMFGEAIRDAQDEAAAEAIAEADADVNGDEEEQEEEASEEEEEQQDDGEDIAGDREEEEEVEESVTAVAAVGEEDGEEESEEHGAEDDQEKNADDFQLAFENLDAARLIYIRDPEKFAKELVEVYTTVGEVYMETDQFENAEAEFKKALELVKKDENHSQRQLASYLYMIGISYSAREKFVEALDYLEQSCDALVKYAEMLTSISFEGLLLNESIQRISEFIENRTKADVLQELSEVVDILKDVSNKIEEHKFAKDSTEASIEDIRTMIKETVDELMHSSFPEVDENDDQEVNVVQVKRKGDDVQGTASSSSSSSSSSSLKRKAPANGDTVKSPKKAKLQSD